MENALTDTRSGQRRSQSITNKSAHTDHTILGSTLLCIVKYMILWHVWYTGRLSFNHHHHCLNSYTGFLLIIEFILSCPLLHIVLYLQNNHPTWLVSCIFQISIGSPDHQFHNNLLCLKQNLTWINVLSLSLRLGSGMNSPSL